MQIFRDRQLTEEIGLTLDLGRVDAGETKRFTFWLKNDSKSLLENLAFEVDHPEVAIIKAPKNMTYSAVEELIIEWSPSVTLEEGLKTNIKVTGRRIIG